MIQAWRSLRWAHVRTVASIDLRRRFRRLFDDTASILAIGLLVLFAVPTGLGAIFGLFVVGNEISSGSIADPLELTTIGVVLAWSGFALFGGYRAYAVALSPDRLDGLLTTVSPRELIGGLVFAELLLWGVPLGVFGVMASIAFAAGTGSFWAVPLGTLALASILMTSLFVGFLGALVVRNMGVRSRLLTRIRTLLLALLFLGYLSLFLTQAFSEVFDPVVAVLSPTPIAWYADMLLVGTVSDASVLRATGAVGFTVASIILGGTLLVTLASALWYADGVHVNRTGSAKSLAGNRSVLEHWISPPVWGVMVVDWTRARRSPLTLSFALYPLIVLFGPITQVVQTGEIPTSFPLWLLLCSAWIAGSLFTLNPLGNEAAALPVSVLSTGAGRAIISGHILAALVLVVPPGAVVTGVLAILSPHGMAMALSMAVATIVLSVTAVMIAPGIGIIFPRFDEVTITRGRTAIIPSWFAFGAYTGVLLVVAMPALLTHSALIGGWVADTIGIAPVILGVGGTILSGAVGLAIGLLGTRRAITRVDTYVFDT